MQQSEETFSNSYFIYAFIRGLNFAIENDIRDQIKGTDLTAPAFRILWIVYFHSNIKMTELSFLAQTNISNVFRQLTKLKTKGFVEIENGDDARTKKVTLTKEGREIIHTFISEHKNHSELQIVQSLEKIPIEDLTTFMKVATRLGADLIGQRFGDFVIHSTNDLFHLHSPSHNDANMNSQ